MDSIILEKSFDRVVPDLPTSRQPGAERVHEGGRSPNPRPHPEEFIRGDGIGCQRQGPRISQRGIPDGQEVVGHPAVVNPRARTIGESSVGLQGADRLPKLCRGAEAGQDRDLIAQGIDAGARTVGPEGVAQSGPGLINLPPLQ